MTKHIRRLAFLVGLMVVIAACGGGSGDEGAAAPDPAASPAAGGEEDGATAAAGTEGAFDWDAIVAAAEGQTVNWFMWGGSESINSFVDSTYGDVLSEEYGITLNRVPVADTVNAVNNVIGELQAGVTEGGSVDLIWVNGENFFTLKQADALRAGWATQLPNAELVAWDDPSINTDFGIAVEGMESPWGSAQFQFVFDSDRTTADDVPRSYSELAQWVADNPGRFTYAAPPEFTGTRFLKQAFYEVTGGHEQWQGEFDQELYDEKSPALWEYLKELEPNLHRQGQTYPGSLTDLNRLFANGEVDFTFSQRVAGVGSDVNAGEIPDTARPFVFDTGTIGDHHYLAVPVNAANPEAAMVAANMVLRGPLQVEKFKPENWGDGPAVEVDRLEPSTQEALDEVVSNLDPFAVPPEELQEAFLPEIRAEYTTQLEADWDRFIRQGQPLPGE